jgi:hypothetical protein
MIKMYIERNVSYMLFFSGFNEILIFSTDFPNMTLIYTFVGTIIFMNLCLLCLTSIRIIFFNSAYILHC